METLTIATRGSPLAIWQSLHVKRLLLADNPKLQVELLKIKTSGDKFLGSLSLAGGKGLFVKEIEQCLLDKTADLAVHSMKDLPHKSPEGLEISCILAREDPGDSMVTIDGKTIYDLLPGASVGTSSLRRKSQLLAIRPDLNCKDLRGNVGSRMAKLQDGQFSAVILATAGLKRLGLMANNHYQFGIDLMLPAVGQGAIGIQARLGDIYVKDLLRPLSCSVSTASVKAERKMIQVLGGDCGSPLAGLARLVDGDFVLDGLVSDLQGKTILRTCSKGKLQDPEGLGELVAEELLKKGAKSLLNLK